MSEVEKTEKSLLPRGAAAVGRVGRTERPPRAAEAHVLKKKKKYNPQQILNY
jgi:hypothetical protein